LLFNAREGDAYYAVTRPTGGNRSAKRMQRLLINYNSIEGRARMLSFPVVTFERAIFSLLREIDPHEILNGDSGPDETLTLAGEMAHVETELAEASAFMEANGFSPTIGKRVNDLEARKSGLAERLAAALQRAANPLSETWGEAQTLLAALDNAPDPKDARLRLRTVLRRMVESIWLLVVPRGRDRLAAVQVWFAGGKKHRDYLIYHVHPKANARARQEGGWWALSLADAAALGELDLRKRKAARELERVLATLKLDSME